MFDAKANDLHHVFRFEFPQVALIDLAKIVVVRSPRKIIEHNEHRNHAARSYDLTSNGPFIVSHLTVASTKVLVFSVVRSVHAFSVTSVGSRFVHAILALVVGSERVRTTGAAGILINLVQIKKYSKYSMNIIRIV